MNRVLLLHLLTACAAAALGWRGAGVFHRASEQTVRTNNSAPKNLPAPAKSAPAWEQRLAAARSTPPARAGAALVQWSFGIPDDEVPAAIAALDPWTEMHALRCLYARWARLDPAVAWESFRRSRMPRFVSTHLLLHDDGVFRAAASNISGGGRSREEIAAAMLTSMELTDREFARTLAARLLDPDSEDARFAGLSGMGPVFREGKRITGDSLEKESARVAAAAENLPAGLERGKAIRGAAAGWMLSRNNAVGKIN